ncbi:MAG: DUF116 domain-containing protein [candidate division Zixibacteria bacterium]|nr:DUF116 domain-containing protein [candidate division Zixibacteria bacterium]MDH3937337.1 DUF116 domain-containing protein [candidate division Zixibacteria bacterium]MDH4033544.1 DUF116 domain-containing protein [candidate division Zixibacteria bacterium]
MEEQTKKSDVKDRKLGDEWEDWDGSATPASTESNARLFLVLSVLAIAGLIAAVGLFLWLISPRLSQFGTLLPRAFAIAFGCFALVLFVWVALFAWSAATRRPLTRLIVVPRLVNRLLSLVIGTGKLFGISSDRLTNSFLKIHNLFVTALPALIPPERLLILAPRCLTRDNNIRLRRLRDEFGFHMAVCDGGTAARQKIRAVKPRLVLAIACERDLISGFKEINPFVPVIGFPNQRPEGPCKNTCIDLSSIERTVRKCLGVSPEDRLENG